MQGLLQRMNSANENLIRFNSVFGPDLMFWNHMQKEKAPEFAEFNLKKPLKWGEAPWISSCSFKVVHVQKVRVQLVRVQVVLVLSISKFMFQHLMSKYFLAVHVSEVYISQFLNVLLSKVRCGTITASKNGLEK